MAKQNVETNPTVIIDDYHKTVVEIFSHLIKLYVDSGKRKHTDINKSTINYKIYQSVMKHIDPKVQQEIWDNNISRYDSDNKSKIDDLTSKDSITVNQLVDFLNKFTKFCEKNFIMLETNLLYNNHPMVKDIIISLRTSNKTHFVQIFDRLGNHNDLFDKSSINTLYVHFNQMYKIVK